MFILLLGLVFWLLMFSIWGDGDSYVYFLRGDCYNDFIRVLLIIRYWFEEKLFNFLCKVVGFYELFSRNKFLFYQLYYYVKDDLFKLWFYVVIFIIKIIYWDDFLNVFEFSGFKCNCM